VVAGLSSMLYFLHSNEQLPTQKHTYRKSGLPQRTVYLSVMGL
jgi:hypothetical protein